MGALIDSSLWVDYFRMKTPRAVKEQVVAVADEENAVLCEPVRLEILRAALRTDRRRVEETFATLPMMSTPPHIWQQAMSLGQSCLDEGLQPPSMDLLIASVCLHHGIEIVTFDTHFADIAKVSPLKVRLLKRET